MILTEDPTQIQDEVMAEITSALNINQEDQKTPTATEGSVPDVARSPDSGTCDLTEVDESLGKKNHLARPWWKRKRFRPVKPSRPRETAMAQS